MIIWNIDNVDKIGGHDVTLLGNPQIIETYTGPAIEFNGADDGIILNTNPLTGLYCFTVEIIFRPDSGGNKEQRFFHSGEDQGSRVLIETRLMDDHQWFLDTYIKSGKSERTLFAKDFLHSLDGWYHAALIFDGQNMQHFVNGVKELQGTVDYTPMAGGQTSIGCRMNKVYWFRGAIRKVKITPGVLSPREFMSV